MRAGPFVGRFHQVTPTHHLPRRGAVVGKRTFPCRPGCHGAREAVAGAQDERPCLIVARRTSNRGADHAGAAGASGGHYQIEGVFRHELAVVALMSAAPQPWRNGGGVTRELLAGRTEDWSVRLSVADIERDGPFSAFAGVDRWFAVLSGAGVVARQSCSDCSPRRWRDQLRR